MKKIILAMDPRNFKPETLDFPAYLTKLAHARLTGIFVEDITPELYLRINNPDAFAFMTMEEQEELLHVNTEKEINAHIETFRKECGKRGIVGKVFSEKGIPSREMVMQSRYADMLLTNIDTTFSSSSASVPAKFTRYIMANAECPVIITPEEFKGIEEVVFAFDGSASAVFAIRQFTYLLPELSEKRATVLYSNESDVEKDLEGKEELMEWMQLHYEDAYFKTETGSIFNSFISAYRKHPAMIGVMGAYGRSGLSRFFQESSADDILKLISIPLFITHY